MLQPAPSALAAPLRVGDPLGLGAARPPPPPDPDTHDLGLEDKAFARSLLSESERAALDSEIKKAGFLAIGDVRALVAGQCSKGSLEAGGLDPEILALIDARVNYKIFVAGDNLYLREELYAHFPFQEFNVQPEAVFVRQELGVFPARRHALPGDADKLEYVVRDEGDESVEFTTIEDLVGRATRPGYQAQRAPLRVAKTKIFVGKDRWHDFELLHRFARGAARVAAAQLTYSGGAGGPAFFDGLLGRGPGRRLLADEATEARAREERAAAREAALAAQEREIARLAAEQAAVSARLEADIRRLEGLLSGRAVPAPAPHPAGGGAAPSDAVPLSGRAVPAPAPHPAGGGAAPSDTVPL